MTQFKNAPQKELDPEVEKVLNLHSGLDEIDISFLDNDDNAKPPRDGLDNNTPCFVKRHHFLTNDERQAL